MNTSATYLLFGLIMLVGLRWWQRRKEGRKRRRRTGQPCELKNRHLNSEEYKEK